MRPRRSALALALTLTLLMPTLVLANSADARTSCDWVTGRVGWTNTQYGAITYFAQDWWVPKTGRYTTVWHYRPVHETPWVTAGDAPRGGWFIAADPDFGILSFRQNGTFTVWGDATKWLNTRAVATGTRFQALVGTTTGPGGALVDRARCSNANGWVTINN